MKLILPMLCACLLLSGTTISQGALNAWINEFHYDNNSSDVGEFVEVVAPSSVSDLANVVLTLYNGSGGAAYATHNLSTFTAGTTVEGFTTYSKAISGIQNGNPDGFALSYTTGLIQFLSYGGTFIGSGGVAAGVLSVDIGVAEPGNQAAGGSLGLTGTGSSYLNFTWTAFNDDTPGNVNLGQSILAPVPEPITWAMLSFGTLFGGLQLRRYLRSRAG